MALMDIGSICTAFARTTTAAVAKLDDNIVSRVFYPIQIGFLIVIDPLALPNDALRRLNSYIYWS